MQKNFIILFLVFFGVAEHIAAQTTSQLLLDTLIVDTTNVVAVVKKPKKAIVPLTEIKEHLGTHVNICGTVVSAAEVKNDTSKMVALMVLQPKEKEKFELQLRFMPPYALQGKPEKIFENKSLCFSGIITIENSIAVLLVDTAEQRRLSMAARQINSLPKKAEQAGRRPLQTNAYLLAGPSLSEPVITHLRKGSIVTPIYVQGKWAYVKVVNKSGTDETPVALNGFIRRTAVDFKSQPVTEDGSL